MQGIETFTADMHRSLVREIIQNSLDAKNPQVDGPVSCRVQNDYT